MHRVVRRPSALRSAVSRVANHKALLIWVVAALALPAGVAAGAAVLSEPGIERQLAGQVETALAARGITAKVAFDGRDVTISNVPFGRGDAALAAAKTVAGVGSVTVREQARPSEPPKPAILPLLLTITNDEVALTGAVPSEQLERNVVATVQHACAGRHVVGALQVVPGVSVPWQPAVVGQLAAAVIVSRGQRTVTWDGSGVTVSGTVPDAEAKATVEDAVRRAVGAVPVRGDLTVARDVTAPFADLAELRTTIDQFLADSPIEFGSDTGTTPAEGAGRIVRQVGQWLLAGRDRIGGHTVMVDSYLAGTGQSSSQAMVVSQKRADAIRSRLVGMGFPAERIIARGFGDTKPRNTSNPAESHAANRRVEITIG